MLARWFPQSIIAIIAVVGRAVFKKPQRGAEFKS
jgi:hypothetical protein